ncbi:MAG: SEC-C metal-binding domain-containing protein [Planctomycetota bacterium]
MTGNHPQRKEHHGTQRLGLDRRIRRSRSVSNARVSVGGAFNSETSVKRGYREIQTEAGRKELIEKLGRNDPCPCGSGLRFQEVLPDLWAA